MTTYASEQGSVTVEVAEVVLYEQGSRLAGGGDPLVLRQATMHVSSAFGSDRVVAVGYAETDADAVAAAFTIWDNKRREGHGDD